MKVSLTIFISNFDSFLNINYSKLNPAKTGAFLISFIFLGLFVSGELFAQETQQQTNQSEQTTQSTTAVTSPAQVSQPQSQVVPVSKPKPFADELSISDQFSYAIDKSSNFQDYKVIKQTWMTKLKSNTLDTLITLRTSLKSSNDLVLEKTKAIETLRSELTTSQTDLLEKNSFKFFGLMVSKAGYDSIMWSIIIGLIVAFWFMFAAFRRGFAVTSQTKKDLNDIKDEYESYRKKALKSKEEAVRQLYDELNKYKNRK
jgi:hypothetical protein